MGNKKFVLSKYKTATIKKIMPDAWCYVFQRGSAYAIGSGPDRRSAWRDAATRIKTRIKTLMSDM